MSFCIAEQIISQRLLLGTALFPSLASMQQAIKESQTEVVTVSLRRQNQSNKGNIFWQHIKNLQCHVLPNTAGCRTAKEAITTAHMAREIFATNWIKLEVIGDDYTLQPHPLELLKATQQLIADGFEVLPFCTEDLILCQQLVDLGCKIIMPWGSPIGSGQGLLNIYALNILRQRLPHICIIIDAGMGSPSQAAQAMEMGFDGVLLNTAIACALDPVKMAQAFAAAVQAGRLAFEAGLIAKRDFAKPSTPLLDIPFHFPRADVLS